jgi:hypothetical protein
VYLVRRPESDRRLAGFRELPEKSAVSGAEFEIAHEFTHQIVGDRFRVRVWRAGAAATLPEGEWVALDELPEIAVATIARKAIRTAGRFSQ